MKFDYTFIRFGNFLVFEPMIIVTNLIFFILAWTYYRRLSRFDHPYAVQGSLFMLLLGISGIFGALGHSVHYQWGTVFLDTMVFLMNAFSLLAMYFAFRLSYTHWLKGRPERSRYIYIVVGWVSVLLIASFIGGSFTLIKIHAGIVLVYCLGVHFSGMRKNNEKGSALVVYGILLSFGSILVHSLHLSFGEWFNHKDIAHVFMITTMILMYKGFRKNLGDAGAREKMQLTAQA